MVFVRYGVPGFSERSARLEGKKSKDIEGMSC